MIMFMFLMHEIVVLSTSDYMHGMSLYDVLLHYIHRMGLIWLYDEVFLVMNEIVYACIGDVWSAG